MSIMICALVGFMIFYRLIAFIVEGGCEAWNTVGAVFFGAYVFFNMCPMASISLNERLSSAADEEKEHKPISLTIAILI